MLQAKTCSRCRELRPVEDFNRNRARPDGLAHYCRPCVAASKAEAYARRPEAHRQAARSYYSANREKCLDAAREYRETNRESLRKMHRERSAERRRTEPEKVRAQYRDWCLANRDDLLAKQRARRVANPAQHRAWVAAWQAKNQPAVREWKRRYRIRKKAAPEVPFTTQQLAEKVAYWGGKCWMCGAAYDAIDHVKPLAKGGWHCLSNLRPACSACNGGKRDKWPFTPPQCAA